MALKNSAIKNIRPIEPPCKKKIYHSQEEAEDMINFIKETRVSKKIRLYKCSVCGFWHLTSRFE
jgi:hypothetical protein